MFRNSRWIIGIILNTMLLATSCGNLNQTKAPDNQAITNDIQAKLFADPNLKQRDIRVTTEEGIVILTGQVLSDLEKAAVERMAAQSAGVRKVVNQLTVGTQAAAAPAPAAEPATPAAPAPVPASKPVAKPMKPVAAAPAEPEMVPAAPEAPEPAAATAPPEPSRPAVREPVKVTIPEGTSVMIRMIDTIDSSVNKPGEEFAATVSQPVVVDEHIVIRKGADARVRLINAKTAGKMTGRSELEVELVGLAIGSQTFAVESTGIAKEGASRGARTAKTVGGGAALGGLIGAIAGKGKGAAIGAAIGAGAGTAVQVLTKGEQVKIPSETQLEFALRAPITVTM